MRVVTGMVSLSGFALVALAVTFGLAVAVDVSVRPLLLMGLPLLPDRAVLGALVYGLPMYLVTWTAAALQRRRGVGEQGGPG